MSSEDEYYTIEKDVHAEIKIKGSRFISHAFPTNSVADAESIIEQISKKYFDASHNCYAFLIREKGQIVERANDAGEPGGTAGPPILNVLKGDISIVGPRPPLPVEVEMYQHWQRRRLSLKPGITCTWQVSGRNNIDFERWMEMDLEYIDNWSLWLDLKIMFKTFCVVLSGYGAQ